MEILGTGPRPAAGGEADPARLLAQQSAAKDLARRLVAQASRDPSAVGDGDKLLSAPPVDVPSTRLELDVDDASGRVVGRFVDQETGAVIRQVPSEEMVRLLARAREMIGALLDEHA